MMPVDPDGHIPGKICLQRYGHHSGSCSCKPADANLPRQRSPGPDLSVLGTQIRITGPAQSDPGTSGSSSFHRLPVTAVTALDSVGQNTNDKCVSGFVKAVMRQDTYVTDRRQQNAQPLLEDGMSAISFSLAFEFYRMLI